MSFRRGMPAAWRWCAALSWAIAALLVARVVSAAPPSSGPPPTTAAATILTLAANPVFGADAASGDGWIEVVVRVENVSTAPVRGTLELTGTTSSVKAAETQATTRAPFNVPAGASAIFHLPAHATVAHAPTLVLTAIGEGGVKLADTLVSASIADGPLVVDVSPTPRLAVAMRGWPMTPTWTPFAAFSSGSPYVAGSATAFAMTHGSPHYDPVTGDPVLPDRAAGYAPASAVIMHSETLAKLEGEPLEALVNWVLAGGTLAIVMGRPEDMRSPTIASLVGGVITAAPSPRSLLNLEAIERPPAANPFDTPDPRPVPTPTPTRTPPPFKAFGSDGGLPIQWVPVQGPSKKPTTTTPRRGPLPSVAETLQGYAGGNLRESELGMSTPYGLGEVHVLAFDPTVSPGIDDLWVHTRIVNLAQRAFARHAAQVFPHGAGNRRGNDYEEVRRALDPNESFRPALAIAAILLVVYSIVVGPVVFLRAAKRGRPLDPLVWVPIVSGLALTAIVVVALGGKGWRGRARHLSLVEAGGGMSRGPVRRFRALYASGPRGLSIHGSERGGVLDLAVSETDHTQATVRIEKNAAALEEITALPWQTVIINEHGFLDLGGGIAVVPSADGSADVVNRSGRELRDLLVHVPGQPVTYFEVLKDGDRLHASAGKVTVPSSRSSRSSKLRSIHALDVGPLRGTVPAPVIDAWHAFAQAAGGATVVDWWPDDEPVVMGEIAGGEGVASDTGLEVEKDQLFFRVVGKGGTL